MRRRPIREAPPVTVSITTDDDDRLNDGRTRLLLIRRTIKKTLFLTNCRLRQQSRLHDTCPSTIEIRRRIRRRCSDTRRLLSISLSPSVSPSVCLSLYLPLFFCFSVSVSLSLFSVSVCLCMYLSVWSPMSLFNFRSQLSPRVLVFSFTPLPTVD